MTDRELIVELCKETELLIGIHSNPQLQRKCLAQAAALCRMLAVCEAAVAVRDATRDGDYVDTIADLIVIFDRAVDALDWEAP